MQKMAIIYSNDLCKSWCPKWFSFISLVFSRKKTQLFTDICKKSQNSEKTQFFTEICWKSPNSEITILSLGPHGWLQRLAQKVGGVHAQGWRRRHSHASGFVFEKKIVSFEWMNEWMNEWMCGQRPPIFIIPRCSCSPNQFTPGSSFAVDCKISCTSSSDLATSTYLTETPRKIHMLYIMLCAILSSILHWVCTFQLFVG
jgi:hypothetical protein